MRQRAQRRWRVAAAVALCAVLTQEPALADEAAVLNGKRIAAAHCARCHAIGRQGASPLARAPAFRTLSRRYPLDHLAEALAEGIMTGHAEMPQFAFEPEEIGALLAYMRSISDKRP